MPYPLQDLFVFEDRGYEHTEAHYFLGPPEINADQFQGIVTGLMDEAARITMESEVRRAVEWNAENPDQTYEPTVTAGEVVVYIPELLLQNLGFKKIHVKKAGIFTDAPLDGYKHLFS